MANSAAGGVDDGTVPRSSVGLWSICRPLASASFITMLLGSLVFAIPFLAYGISILHVFYISGSAFYDAGWCAYLIHDADLQIHDPAFINGGVSWFYYHISPLFLLTSALGHILPLTRIQFYAAYIGTAHALLGVAAFWLLVSGYRLATPSRLLAAALLALLFSFNGLALAVAKFPNYTEFLVGSGAMFLAALVLRRYRVAAVFFILCLSTREDAGFHLFALLSLAVLCEWWRGATWRELKPYALFGLLALLYSCGVIALQNPMSSGESDLVLEYLGRPLFAGVTLSSMATRFLGWVAFRGYVVFPAMVAIVWAIIRRNPQIALGYIAFVPWGLLHLAAAKAMLGTLPSYYAFPYLLAAFWPLVGLSMQRNRGGEARSVVEPMLGFAVLTAASFMPSPYQHNPANMHLPADFISPPSIARQRATGRALVRLAGAPELGSDVVDQSVLALVPEHFPSGNTLNEKVNSAPDSVIYFADGFEAALARRTAAAAGLDRLYAVPGTSIRVASKRAIGGVAGLTELPASGRPPR